MTTPDEVLAVMCASMAESDGLYFLRDDRAAVLYADKVKKALTAAEALGWRLVPVEATEPEELLPCPFCGGEAKIIETDDGNNVGGSCVECQSCLASSAVEFGFKETLHSRWNRRPAPKVTP